MRQADGFGDLAKGLIEDLYYGAPLAALLPFFVAGLAPTKGKVRNDLVALSVASLIGMVTLARQATAFGPDDRVRYYYPYVVAMALLTAASVGRSRQRAAVVAACLGMHLAASRENIHKMMQWEIDKARKAVAEDDDRRAFEAVGDDYRDIQSHVPRRATMVTAVNENDRFDFARNRIFSLDFLGGMGPKPGWPTHMGAEALAEYLVANGVQYIVWVDFDQGGAIYKRSHWYDHLARQDYLHGEAILAIDAAETIDQLATIRRIVYRAHNMSVLDLSYPPDKDGAEKK